MILKSIFNESSEGNWMLFNNKNDIEFDFAWPIFIGIYKIIEAFQYSLHFCNISCIHKILFPLNSHVIGWGMSLP